MTLHPLSNGDAVERAPICHACQTPGASIRAEDGEMYHFDCLEAAIP